MRWAPTAAAAERALDAELDRARPGTVLVTVGAGDIYKLGEALVAGAPSEVAR